MVLNAVKSITLNTSELLIVFKNGALSELLKITERQFKPECYEFTVPYTSKKRGVETKLILGNSTHNNFDHTLIRNLAKANLYYSAIKQGQTFQQIADEHQTSKRQIQYLIELAFLSPKTVTEISRGEQSIGLTSQYLREISIPSNWGEQEKIFSSL